MELGERALPDRLPRPPADVPVVHVVGTNGKGSVAAMVTAGLEAAGRRVALFTSPDLGDPLERFRGLDRASYLRYQALVDAAVGEASLGLFARWCAMAWLWLAETRPDVAVIEAGVGARDDATNVVSPALVLVTAVGLDHADRLGPTIADVAGAKAAAIKPGVPVLTTARGEALEVLTARAAEVGAPLRAVAPLEGRARPGKAPNRGGAETASAAAAWDLGFTQLPLAGRFQLENAALAKAALEHLGIPLEAIARGFADVRWPGRMETMQDPAGGSWLLDGAHNAPAIAALVESWGSPEVVVLGIQRRKDAAAMVALLGERPIVAVAVPGAEDPWQPEELARFAPGRLVAAEDVPAALRLARLLAPDGLRCVTGSLYLVGAARGMIERPVGAT